MGHRIRYVRVMNLMSKESLVSIEIEAICTEYLKSSLLTVNFGESFQLLKFRYVPLSHIQFSTGKGSQK